MITVNGREFRSTAQAVMTMAHWGRVNLARRFDCDPSELIWSECLKVAWELVKEHGVETCDEDTADEKNQEDIAECVASIAAEALAEARGRNAEDFECNVWAKYNKLRVYLPNSWGYLVIKDNGKVAIDGLKGQAYQDVLDALKANNIDWCWE